MKTLKTIQKLCRLGAALSKAAFVLAVVGFCGCAAGILSAALGDGSVVRWGGVTFHGLLSGFDETALHSAAAALCGWAILCAGEAVLAQFAELYFKNEQQAGTPFTLAGAKELKRLGVLTIVLPAGCALAAEIAEGVAANYMNVAAEIGAPAYFETGASISLGVMFLVTSLLCRCAAEQGGAKE